VVELIEDSAEPQTGRLAFATLGMMGEQPFPLMHWM
jgi:hypothetical protein